MSKALATLVDFRRSLQSLAELAVAELADFCAVWLVSSHGEIQCAALAHFDSRKQEELSGLVRQQVLDWSDPSPMERVLRQGATESRPAVSDPEAAQHALVPGPYVCAPLTVRGKPLGCLFFGAGQRVRRIAFTATTSNASGWRSSAR